MCADALYGVDFVAIGGIPWRINGSNLVFFLRLFDEKMRLFCGYNIKIFVMLWRIFFDDFAEKKA